MEWLAFKNKSLNCPQIARAIQDSLCESSPIMQRDASMMNGAGDAFATNVAGDAFSIENFVRDVDNAGPSTLADHVDEERHNETCDVSYMSTTSDGDDCSSLSGSGENVRFCSEFVGIRFRDFYFFKFET